MHRAILLAATVFLASAAARAQAPAGGSKPAPSPLAPAAKQEPSLAQLLEQALKQNPDIQAAEAKLRDAEAELHRTRLKALSRLVALQHEIAALRAAAEEAQMRLERANDLRKRGAISAEETSLSATAAQKGKAEVARVEAEQAYVLGQAPANLRIHLRAVDFLAPRGTAAAPPPPVEMAPPSKLAMALRPLLDKSLKLGLDEPIALREVVEFLGTQVPGINIALMVDDKVADETKRLTLKQAIPLGAIFQWLEDTYQVRCVVREYGIVIAERDRVPPGAIHVLDLWRQLEVTR
jgi:hypothetical protein